MRKKDIRIRNIETHEIKQATDLIRQGLCEHIPYAIKMQFAENLKLQTVLIGIAFGNLLLFGGDFVTLISTFVTTSLIYVITVGLYLRYYILHEETSDLDEYKLKSYWRFWVAEALEQGKWKIVGTIGLKRSQNDCIEMKRVSVHPKYRCQGAASQLLDHAIANAAQSHFKEIYLMYSSSQRQAMRFYPKHGFCERSNFRFDAFFGTFSVTVYEVVKECKPQDI